MELFESELDKLAENIKQLEKQREILGNTISSIKKSLLFTSKDPDILEDKFIFKVKEDPLEKLKVAAVDGGIVNSQYHGTNLVVGRAAAVLFDFKNGNLLETNYYPDAFPTPTPIAFMDPISSRDFAIGTSITRDLLEVALATRTVDKFAPDVMLLDGSILPHGMEKPKKDSTMYDKYKELISAYDSLYETCKKKKTMLAGCVEDSSGLRLTTLLDSKIIPGIEKSGEFKQDIVLTLKQTKSVLKRTNDSNLMYHVLGVGERSCAFSYTKDPAKHQVLRDLQRFGSEINSFYLKCVEFDRPMRVEFLGEVDKNVDRIASIVYALSAHNETYGCPSIIIEADARAKLSANDLEKVYHRLKDKVGDLPSLFKLRRELRPF